MKFFLFSLIFINFIQATHSSIEEIWIHSNGIQIPCKFFGQGDPLIVLHGGPGIVADDLTPNLLELSQNHLIVFYFQRGSGTSTEKINREMAHWDTFLEDLSALQQALNFKKVTLLGHCWGCGLAIKYAMKYPERIDKLLFISPMPVSFSGCYLFGQRYFKAVEPYAQQLASLTRDADSKLEDLQTLHTRYEIYAKPFFYNPEIAKLLIPPSSSEQFNRTCELTHLFSANELSKPFNWLKDIKNITLPTLIIHGACDFVPSKIPEEIHKNMPNSQYILIDECGHCPLFEKPKETCKYIQLFLSSN